MMRLRMHLGCTILKTILIHSHLLNNVINYITIFLKNNKHFKFFLDASKKSLCF